MGGNQLESMSNGGKWRRMVRVFRTLAEPPITRDSKKIHEIGALRKYAPCDSLWIGLKWITFRSDHDPHARSTDRI